MARIEALTDDTIDRIAAGEVVERPASVVKELIENSLDAGAERITIELTDGGIERIRVGDDGVGMTREDLERAVDRHTTSKIRDIEDLESGVETLGFRGEALHTIGAVSRLTVTTRPRAGALDAGGDGADGPDSPDEGARLRVEGGEVQTVEPAGRPPGTTVEVRDLFYNTPARRAYLGTETTEFGHVNRVATHYALANPAVAITLEHNDREVFATTGQGDLEGTIMAVYGREVATAMGHIEAAGEGLPPGPIDTIEGYVSDPETNRSTREYVTTFVNGRYVTDADLRNAVVDAYGDQLASDRYPFAVVFLELDPATVDVNVHPRKLEVRFADETGAHQQIESAVRNGLLSQGLIRTSAPRGRSAPAETDVQPRSSVESTVGDAATEDAAGSARESQGTGPSGTAPDQARPTSSASTDETTAFGGSSTATRGSSPDAGAGTERSLSQKTAPDEPSTLEDGDQGSAPSRADETAARPGDPENCAAIQESEPGENHTGLSTVTDQTSLETGVEPNTEFEGLPSLSILGQFQDTYVVCGAENGLVLIDQHAADERIHYERLLGAFDAGATSQRLATPITLELTAQEAGVFEAHAADLAELGFETDRPEERTVSVHAVPAVFDETVDPSVLRDALSSFAAGADGASDVAAVAEDLLADLACYPAITGSTSLREGSILDLLDSLAACENPYACPHGRPVLVELSTDELAARFERDYPGHGPRRSE